MARYTKLPVTIEAVQFKGIRDGKAEFEDGAPDGAPVPEWLTAAMEREQSEPGFILPMPRYDELVISTLEGTMTAYPGDWIIRGVKGELYPCKPDIFAQTYMSEDDPFLPKPLLTFRDDLASCINRWSIENGSNTPDTTLADFCIEAMRALDSAINKRERWYGRENVLTASTVYPVPPDGPADNRPEFIRYPAPPQPAPFEQPDDLCERVNAAQLADEPALETLDAAPEPHETFERLLSPKPEEPYPETVEDLLNDVAKLLRGYEAHHREKARVQSDAATGHENHASAEVLDKAAADRLEKAERNARMAERVEAMLRLVMQDFVGIPKLADLSDRMKGAALVEEGACWIKVHFREIGGQSALFDLLSAAKIAAERA